MTLRRYSYSEISRFSRHSPAAIQRYLITFGRVVLLLRRGFKAREIAFLCGISERLAREYIELLEKNAEGYAERIEEIAELVSSRPASSDKKGAA